MSTSAERQSESGAEVLLCSLQVGRRRFGVETSAIGEVLESARIYRVPRAEAYVAGMIAHRGEVLTAVSLRVVLGLAPHAGTSRVLVLAGEPGRGGGNEPFGLVVDEVGGVEELQSGRRQSLGRGFQQKCPGTVLPICMGAFERNGELLLQLDPRELSPERLAQSMARQSSQTAAGNEGPAHEGFDRG